MAGSIDRSPPHVNHNHEAPSGPVLMVENIKSRGATTKNDD